MLEVKQLTYQSLLVSARPTDEYPLVALTTTRSVGVTSHCSTEATELAFMMSFYECMV